MIPFIVLKLLLPHSDTAVTVGRTVGFVSPGYTIIPSCTSRDGKAKISSTVKHVFKCNRHLSRQAGILPCSGNPSITILQALGKAGGGTPLWYCLLQVCPGCNAGLCSPALSVTRLSEAPCSPPRVHTWIIVYSITNQTNSLCYSKPTAMIKEGWFPVLLAPINVFPSLYCLYFTYRWLFSFFHLEMSSLLN